MLSTGTCPPTTSSSSTVVVLEPTTTIATLSNDEESQNHSPPPITTTTTTTNTISLVNGSEFVSNKPSNLNTVILGGHQSSSSSSSSLNKLNVSPKPSSSSLSSSPVHAISFSNQSAQLQPSHHTALPNLKYICEICGILTLNLDSLKQHLSLHNGAKLIQNSDTNLMKIIKLDDDHTNHHHHHHQIESNKSNELTSSSLQQSTTTTPKIGSIIASAAAKNVHLNACSVLANNGIIKKSASININIPQSMTVFNLKDISTKLNSLKPGDQEIKKVIVPVSSSSTQSNMGKFSTSSGSQQQQQQQSVLNDYSNNLRLNTDENSGTVGSLVFIQKDRDLCESNKSENDSQMIVENSQAKDCIIMNENKNPASTESQSRIQNGNFGFFY
jgi:hypothetical protein